MSFKNTVAMAALGLILTFGSAAQAAPATAASPAASASPGATKNDVTGTIKNWKSDSFELQGAKGRPWKFSYSKTTKMTGTPANGAKAEVLFLDQKGKHVATQVTVSK